MTKVRKWIDSFWDWFCPLMDNDEYDNFGN